METHVVPEAISFARPQVFARGGLVRDAFHQAAVARKTKVW